MRGTQALGGLLGVTLDQSGPYLRHILASGPARTMLNHTTGRRSSG